MSDSKLFLPLRTRPAHISWGLTARRRQIQNDQAAFQRAFDGDHRTCSRCGHVGCAGTLGSIHTPNTPFRWMPDRDHTKMIWSQVICAASVIVQTCRRCGAIELFDISTIDYDRWWPSDHSLLESTDCAPELLDPTVVPDLPARPPKTTRPEDCDLT